MKIKLEVSTERSEEIKAYLIAHGIEVSDDSELVLLERSGFASHIAVHTADSTEKIFLPVSELVFAESYGHNIYIHTEKGLYISSEPLTHLMSLLDPVKFFRASNSVIISRLHVKEIRPTISRKFILRMSTGDLVDVTRSYYQDFKDYFGLA